MAGTQLYNTDLDVLGNIKVADVPNNTGSLVTYNSSTKILSLRTNSQIVADLGLSNLYEPKFTKNTAFNKNFGTTAGTVAQGNDSRINNGQTAFSWGNFRDYGLGSNISTNYGSWNLTTGHTSFLASNDHGSNLAPSASALFGFKQIYGGTFGGEIGYRNNRIGFRT